jgi:hypothetical protein
MEQQHSDGARLAQLEHRVRVLEDVNAIRHLKARYAAYCDDQYNPEGLAALFTEDAVWESQGLGRFEGRDAIRTFFRGASQLFTFAIHYSLNGQRLLLDSRVVDVPMAYNPTCAIFSSLKPLFFHNLKSES